jgi:hypothetical protein
MIGVPHPSRFAEGGRPQKLRDTNYEKALKAKLNKGEDGFESN